MEPTSSKQALLLRFSRRLLTLSPLIALGLYAQRGPGGPPPMRKHTATAAQPLPLVPATEQPPGPSQQQITVEGTGRIILSNALPDHPVGRFPNNGNPHSITAQRYSFTLPSVPQAAAQITSLHHRTSDGPPNQPFGIALNGVLLDPGTAEFWNGDRSADWNYDALGGAVALGLDENHGHVQPSGAYHYHGLPKPVMDQLSLRPERHSPLIGWAADGFPVYALRGYVDPEKPASGMKTLRSSYALKSGQRPSPPMGPGGAYDGAFVQDYEYVADSGDLDECNGRFAATPEFPRGTYAYFLTAEWPVIPRAFHGTPVSLRGSGGPSDPGPGGPGFGGPPDSRGKGKGKGPPRP